MFISKALSWTMRSNTMDADYNVSSNSARDTEQRSSDRFKLLNHQDQRSERKIDRANQVIQEEVMVRQQPMDRDLHGSSRSTKIELEAQTDLIRTQLTRKHNEIMERKEKEWQDTYAGLKQELAIAQDSFKRCQTDLWRLQPLPQVTDTEILNDFDELCHRVSSWIDDEIAIAEKLDDHSRARDFFQDGGDTVLASWMHEFPNFGEFYVRHVIHRFLCSTIFSTYLVGLPLDAVALLQVAERTMPNLTPPRDMDSILSWRSETLTALSNAEEFDGLKEKEVASLTTSLFGEILPVFPISAQDSPGRRQRLKRSVMAPATDLAIKMQVSKTGYQVELHEDGDGYGGPLVREHLQAFSCFDVKTRKRIKATSRVIVGREGQLGSMVMPIEPFVGRVSNDGTIKELRTDTFLVALD